jgi:hypothetical protein
MAEQTARTLTSIAAPSKGRRVQDSLNRYKANIDATIQEGGTLMAAMIAAGEEVGLRADIGQPALLHLYESLGAAIRQRGLAIKTHSDLSALADRVNLRETAFGDLDKSPEKKAELVSPAVAGAHI